MVYVTHDQTEALTFADKVVVMYEGQIVQIGTPAELFEKPKHTFVGYFIGSPGMNVFPVAVEGSKARVGGMQSISAMPRRSRRAEDRTRHPAGIHGDSRRRAFPSASARWKTLAASGSSRADAGGRQAVHRGEGGRRDPGGPPCQLRSRASTSTPIPGASDGRPDHEQDLEQQGLVHGPAGLPDRRILGHRPADDGGQLFGAGHVRQQRFFWAGTDWFKEILDSRPLLGRAGAQSDVLSHRSPRSRFRSASSSR